MCDAGTLWGHRGITITGSAERTILGIRLMLMHWIRFVMKNEWFSASYEALMTPESVGITHLMTSDIF